MADRLTQLQDSLDDLLTQMYATLNYIQNRAPYGEIPGQPSQAPQPSQSAPNSAAPGGALTNGNAAKAQTNGESKKDELAIPVPEEPAVFHSALREMARDLILEEQKAEILINSLPGIGSSEQDQERRMRELEMELRQVEAQRARAEEEREKMVEVLGEVLVGVRRVG